MACSNCPQDPEPTDLHTCPYAEDVQGDSESLCACCPACEHECAMDI